MGGREARLDEDLHFLRRYARLYEVFFPGPPQLES